MAEEKKETHLKKAFQEVLEVLKHPPTGENELKDLEIEEVIERLEGALGTLNTEMDRIYKESGMSREQMEEYAQNPDNFSKEEWKLLGQVREELNLFEEEAEAALGPTPVEMAAGGHEVVEKGAKKRSPKGRKGWKRA